MSTTTSGAPAAPQLHPDLEKFLAQPKHALLSGGKRVDAASGKTFATRNPATGEVIAQVAEGDREDVDRAVKAARQALSGPWGKMSPAERERILERLAEAEGPDGIVLR